MATIGNIGQTGGALADNGDGTFRHTMWAESEGMPNIPIILQQYSVRREREPLFTMGGSPVQHSFSNDNYRKTIHGSMTMSWNAYYQLNRRESVTLVAQHGEYELRVSGVSIIDYHYDNSDMLTVSFIAEQVANGAPTQKQDLSTLTNKELSGLVLRSEY